MKRIPLPRGKFALVDDDMFDYLSQWTWNILSSGYATRMKPRVYKDGKYLFRSSITMHRDIVMPPKGLTVDHIDGDKLNNQRSNLRVATYAQNACNRRITSANKSGFKGVSWDKQRDRWCAFITINNKTKNLGHFNNPKDAAKRYDFFARKYQGDFAQTNFKDKNEN